MLEKVESISGLLDVKVPASWRKVLQYWQGGVRPSPEETWAALDDLLQAVQTDHCTFRRDVAAALLQPGFTTQPQPWKPVSLPAVLPAAAYDLGTDGQAYGDGDFWAVTYPPQPWNHGWAFRNDGVDLIDLGGPWPVVGAIQAGEYLTWTVDCRQGGFWQASLWYSAPGNQAKVRLEVDGRWAGEISGSDLPATGGWRTFASHPLASFGLSPGRHQLKLVILEPGLDVSRLIVRPAP